MGSVFGINISDIGKIASIGKDIAGIAAGIQTAHGLKQQRKQLKRQEGEQAQQRAEAQAHKAWGARELRYRMGGSRRGGRSTYGMHTGGYPTGLTF